MSYIWIGLTGGPGCGKSEVRKFFSQFPGWQCYDADQICHEIYSEPDSPFVKQLTDRWGSEIRAADGLPNRKKIAEKVFSDEKERQWLNSILHPEIWLRLENQPGLLVAKFVLVEASLLFEAQWNLRMEKTIAVWTSPDIQMARLLTRGWTKAHANKRMQAQLPAQKKLELADYGIINLGSRENLQEQCRRIDSEIKHYSLSSIKNIRS